MLISLFYTSKNADIFVLYFRLLHDFLIRTILFSPGGRFMSVKIVSLLVVVVVVLRCGVVFFVLCHTQIDHIADFVFASLAWLGRARVFDRFWFGQGLFRQWWIS